MLKRLIFGLLLLAGLPSLAHAQAGATVVATCNSLPLAYTPGTTRPITVDLNGQLCSAAAVSASISGFTAATTGTPITATVGGATGALPAGAVVVATNTDTAQEAYCALGASATTASQYIAPKGGWFAFTVGASTQLTCVTSSATAVVNLTGGAGLPTGTGGGGGGGGSTTNITEILSNPVSNTNPLYVAPSTTATWAATQSGAWTVAATQSGTWTVQPGNTANTTPWAFNQTQVNGTAVSVNAGTTDAGTQRVYVSGSAGLADNSTALATLTESVIGGIAQTTPTTCTTDRNCTPSLNPTTRGVRVQGTLGTEGGWTKMPLGGLTNVVQTVKNAAGQLGMLYCYNPHSAVGYVQMFDTTSSVTLGTTAPDEIYGIPTAQSGGLAMTPIGIQYSNAIKVAATTTATGSSALGSPLNCTVAYN